MASRRRKLEEEVFEKFSAGFIERLSRFRIKPMIITVLAFITALVSAAFYYLGAVISASYFLAVVFLALSGFFDAVDGAVARRLKMTSDLGAFLDSVFDKLGEAAIYIAIIASEAVSVFWGALALTSSLMVSYVRHRAEPLGVDLKGVGFMERAERTILLIIATIITPFIKQALEVSMILIAVLAMMTVAWRMLYAIQALGMRSYRRS
ncbi:MAG: CDP-alcohol phosphatidyltransferase family protein [Thaumarchaeota archaeon]|jgi:archaetidylinositol phosphate synthase|nr:CDP-alcohol phosphatidyltransferase family protein [Candidatus Wolframiiraptor allenii]